MWRFTGGHASYLEIQGMTFQGCSLTFNQLEGRLIDISFIHCGTIEAFHTAMAFEATLFKGGNGVSFDSISNNEVLGCTFDSTMASLHQAER